MSHVVPAMSCACQRTLSTKKTLQIYNIPKVLDSRPLHFLASEHTLRSDTLTLIKPVTSPTVSEELSIGEKRQELIHFMNVQSDVRLTFTKS